MHGNSNIKFIVQHIDTYESESQNCGNIACETNEVCKKGKPETRGRSVLKAKWPAIMLLVVYAYESRKQLSLFSECWIAFNIT